MSATTSYHHTIIEAATLAAHASAPDWVTLDCRFELGKPAAGEAAYAAGHIPGARYAHLDRDLAGPVGPTTGRHPLPEPQALARRLAEWGIDRETQVVVYDQGNSFFAARAWWLLRWLGHSQVAVLDGGLAAWLAAGQALETALPRVTPRTFAAHNLAAMAVSAAEVLQSLHSDTVRLVDARGADRYAGENETSIQWVGMCPARCTITTPVTTTPTAASKMRPRCARSGCKRYTAARLPRSSPCVVPA